MAVTAGAFALLAAAADAGRIHDEIMVRFRPGLASESARGAIEGAGGRAKDRIDRMRIWLVKVPPGQSLEETAERLRRNPNVELVEPNMRLYRRALPSDPLLGLQWSLEQIKATLAWGMTVTGAQGSDAVAIAYIDDGVSHSHPDLAGKLLPGYNALDESTNDDADPGEYNDHGTFGAAVAAGMTDNGKGIAGVAWRAKIIPVKIFYPDGSTSEFHQMKGLVWAVDNGARVVNMSLGSCTRDGFRVDCGDGSEMGAEVARYAYLVKGAVVVAAAGNEWTDLRSYPAAYPHVIGVAATGWNGKAEAYTNYGDYIDVAAPGGSGAVSCDVAKDILSATSHPGNACPAFGTSPDHYATKAGTSFASPVVAGLAAVLFGQNPARTNDEVVAIIRGTADQLGAAPWNGIYGYGRVNMYRALTATATGQPAAALRVTVAVFPAAPRYGEDLSIVVTVRNEGSGTAKEIDIAMRANAGGDLLRSPSPSQDVSNLTLAPGESRTLDGAFLAVGGGTVDLTVWAVGRDEKTGAVARAETGLVFPIAGLVAPESSEPMPYPNPVTGREFNLALPLRADASEVTVWVYSAAALKIVYRGTWAEVSRAKGGVIIGRAGDWAPGMYLVRAEARLVSGETQRFPPVKVMVKR